MEHPAYLSWLEKCKAQLGEPDLIGLLEMQLSTSIFVISKRKIRVVETTTPRRKPDEVTIDELTNVLLRTFYFYVENGRADKRFLFCVLGNQLKNDLEKLISKGSLVFENGGGITELAKKIDDDFMSREHLRLRSFVCFDSDAIEPNSPSEQAKAVVDVCETLELPYYCLSRRAIENYIPESALLQYAGGSETPTPLRDKRKKIARAFSRLTSEQKCHFHMKDGLKAKHGSIFETISEPDKETLQVGFGDHLSECYKEGGYATYEKLKASDAWPEAQNIAKTIMEAL